MLRIQEEIEPGCLLIASPMVPMDHHFLRTVILITEHNSSDGSSGFVLNRPLSAGQQAQFAEILTDEKQDSTFSYGGPVGLDHSFCLIDSSSPLAADETLPEGREVTSGILQPDDFGEVIEGAKGNTVQHRRLMFFRGYAGWSVGQLASELAEEVWLLVSGSDLPRRLSEVDNLWSQLLLDLPDSRYHLWSQWPIDCQVN
ncbi:MAG: hypothetical protein CBC13_06675 [Planctomycetia bacterium TMED53]|nr:MAG: hypothetical protein CBC13_06675 [Planctomycetia bacterium TMED53]